MAMLNQKVSADMIEASEFPQPAQKYNVYGVPRTMINEKESIEGLVAETLLVEKIKTSLKA